MENDITQLFEKFLDIEADSNLYNIDLCDVKIWKYIRFSFCDSLLQELLGINYLRSNMRTQKCDDRIKNYQEFTRNHQFWLKKKDLLVINHPRRVKRGKYYRCFVTENLTDCLDYSYYVFEDKYQGKHIGPAKTKHLKYRDITVLEGMFSNKYKNKQKEIAGVVNVIFNVFEKGYNKVLSNKFKTYVNQLVSNTLNTVYYGKIHANIILTLIRPKAVVLTVYYDVINQALIEVAKKKKIPVIELQHGRIGKTHIAYNFKTNESIDVYPDYMFVYGEYERNVPRYPIPKTNIFSVGYPALEERAIYYQKKKKTHKRKVVTFMSSPIDGTIVADTAVKLAEINKDIKVVYKLHPSEYSCWKTNYPNLINSQIKVIESNQHDIYYYLGHSDVVVGISSTTLYEALLFDTKIVVLKYQEYDKCEPLYENGCAALVSDIEELNKIVNCDSKENSKCSNFYFETDSMNKMKRALAKCMKQKR